MITLRSRQLMDVFPGAADRYLDFNTFKDQRDIRKWHVEELFDKAEKGLFRFGEIAFCRIGDDGIDRMVNGQHVCLMITQGDRAIPCVIEKYQVDTHLEFSELFRQFEILARGQPEMVKVEAGALELRWPLWVTNIVVSALTIDKRKQATGTIPQSMGGNTPSKENIRISPSKITKEQRVRSLREYIKEGNFICKILTQDNSSQSSRKNVRHIARAPIAYMMMETWRKNGTKAYKFWEEVRDGAYLTKWSPTKLLREFLIESSGKKGRGFISPNNHQYIYRASVAWNAFIEGRKTALRYRPELQPPHLKAFSKSEDEVKSSQIKLRKKSRS